RAARAAAKRCSSSGALPRATAAATRTSAAVRASSAGGLAPLILRVSRPSSPSFHCSTPPFTRSSPTVSPRVFTLGRAVSHGGRDFRPAAHLGQTALLYRMVESCVELGGPAVVARQREHTRMFSRAVRVHRRQAHAAGLVVLRHPIGQRRVGAAQQIALRTPN